MHVAKSEIVCRFSISTAPFVHNRDGVCACIYWGDCIYASILLCFARRKKEDMESPKLGYLLNSFYGAPYHQVVV